MKVKFVTAIYSNLYGSKFGGRQGRIHHYKYSLLSLMRMSDADFTCYTSKEEINSLENFFYIENNLSINKLKFIEYDLESGPLQNLIFKYKDYEEAKTSHRCFELQYLKLHWILDCITKENNYNYFFWIDAGLSHCGLLPIKYLTMNEKKNYSLGYEVKDYFNSSLFDNILLKSIVNFTGDKIFAVAKNTINGIERFAPNKYFALNPTHNHIIGGIFGAKKHLMKNLIEMFNFWANKILNDTQSLYSEEEILTVVYAKNKEIFNLKIFDIWWHEDSGVIGMTDNPLFFKNKKSFYKILEELREIQ